MTTPKVSPAETKPLWRTGTKLGRTLYLGDVCVGMVDTPEIAAEVVAALNRAAADVSNAETERHIKALESFVNSDDVRWGDGVELFLAAQYLRALQQRVTELEELEADKFNAMARLVAAQKERDAAKRELAELQAALHARNK